MRGRSEWETVTIGYIPFAGSFQFSLQRVVIVEGNDHVAGLRDILCEAGVRICSSEVNLAKPLSQWKAQESPKIARGKRTKRIVDTLTRLDERSEFGDRFSQLNVVSELNARLQLVDFATLTFSYLNAIRHLWP